MHTEPKRLTQLHSRPLNLDDTTYTPVELVGSWLASKARDVEYANRITGVALRVTTALLPATAERAAVSMLRVEFARLGASEALYDLELAFAGDVFGAGIKGCWQILDLVTWFYGAPAVCDAVAACALATGAAEALAGIRKALGLDPLAPR